MNEALANIMERRSIRKYKSTPVSESDLQAVLEAGKCSPTGKNQQSPIMIAVTNPEEINYLEELNAKARPGLVKPFYGAGTVIVVLADASNPNAVYDGSLVMGNLMNAAHAIGLGSCWINRAKEVFESTEGKALLKKWGIEGDYIGVGNCILGYPDEAPVIKPRKENWVYYVR